jgi:hypothetical protein
MTTFNAKFLIGHKYSPIDVLTGVIQMNNNRIALIGVGFLATLFLSTEIVAKERVAVGALCVLQPDAKRIDDMVRIARSRGVQLRPMGEDRSCDNDYRDARAIEVPNGLESWTLTLLRRMGYHVGYSYGTAGGSGPIEDDPQPASKLISEPLTPESLPRVSSITYCKIKSRLSDYFSDIELSQCGDIGFKNGMCRFFWLGGHITNSKGFSSLERTIGRGYWISTKVAIDIGTFNFARENDGSSLDRMALLRVTTLHSVYALMPSYRRPEPSRYHPIEDDIPNLDTDQLDTAIARRVLEILSNAGPLTDAPCN